MSLLQLNRVSVGSVGIQPGNVKMISTANLSIISSAGYLSNNANSPAKAIGLSPSDIIECLYSYNVESNNGTLAYFQPSIINGIITLVDVPGNIVTPTEAGDIAIFNNTSGRLEDSGIHFSDLTQSVAPTLNGVIVTDTIPVFVDNVGTLGSGFAVDIQKSSQGGGSATVVITNNSVTTASVIFAQIQSSANAVTIQKVTPTANTITILCSGDPGVSVFSYQAYGGIF